MGNKLGLTESTNNQVILKEDNNQLIKNIEKLQSENSQLKDISLNQNSLLNKVINIDREMSAKIEDLKLIIIIIGIICTILMVVIIFLMCKCY